MSYGDIEHVLWILLGIAMVCVLGILISGVAIFARGGERNRRYSLLMMNLRVGTQAVIILLLGALLFVHWLKLSGH